MIINLKAKNYITKLIINNYRTDTTGRKVSMFAHNSIKHRIIEEKYNSGNKFLWISANKLLYIITVIYKHGNINVVDFI